MEHHFDLIVIGSGGGGSVGANVAVQHGKKVAIVEKEAVGGDCPNFACIPTKAVLHAADVYETMSKAASYGTEVKDVTLDYKRVKAWKNQVVATTDAHHGQEIFKSEHITLLKGEARFVSREEIVVDGQHYKAHHFLIATGSVQAIPPIPGLKEAGYLTYREAVELDHLPASIFIIGGGAVGCEFAEAFSSFGAKVTIADLLPWLLSREEKEVCEFIEALFQNRGINVLTNTAVAEVSKDGKHTVIHCTTDGKRHTVTTEAVLVATGKVPATQLDLEKAGVVYDKHGIKVNGYMQTNVPTIYAAGDVVGPYLFTHSAEYQSFIAAHNMFSRFDKKKADLKVFPRAVFTSPEVASVGITEQEAKEQGIRVKKAVTPIGIIGRANTEDTLDGLVKIVTTTDGTILGASIVSPRAGEMIHELALAMKVKAKAQDVAEMIHAYPTYSEAIRIACGMIQ